MTEKIFLILAVDRDMLAMMIPYTPVYIYSLIFNKSFILMR